jgi:hypothetical protein
VDIPEYGDYTLVSVFSQLRDQTREKENCKDISEFVSLSQVRCVDVKLQEDVPHLLNPIGMIVGSAPAAGSYDFGDSFTPFGA